MTMESVVIITMIKDDKVEQAHIYRDGEGALGFSSIVKPSKEFQEIIDDVWCGNVSAVI